MTVTVEFYGIPRERAGKAECNIAADTLGELLAELAVELPRFAETCLFEGELRAGFLVSIDGRFFTSDGSTPLPSGTRVLILSADAGG